MFKVTFMRKLLYVVFIFLLFNFTNGSIFDYFPLGKSLFGASNDNENSNELAMQKVPYEIEVTDEKFIQQAAKFTGVSLSDLDKCQHRVILKLNAECHKLNDEELAKLAVKLLNCQSEIEGRTMYPCTDEMPIRDCTSSMDPDTWNSYLLMSNRARAVCYSIRQAQFRGLTEMTVNKLMGTAHEQLNLLNRVSVGQSRVEAATAAAFDRVSSDAAALKRQQLDLRQAQLHGQLQLEDNIRRLADEKQLIIEGHEQLAVMTRDVQNKLDEAARQLDEQAEERRDNHKEILNDLIEIQKQAQVIFTRIEESSRQLLSSSSAAATQYEATLQHLSAVNRTISTLAAHVAWLGAALERHAAWLGAALGGTGDTLDRLYVVTSHAVFLLLAMLACAFLQVAPAGRVALVLMVPANLALAVKGDGALTVGGLLVATVTVIVAQSILNLSLQYWHHHQTKPPTIAAPEPSQPSKEDTAVEHDNTFSSSTFSTYNTYRRFDLDSPDNHSVTGDFDFSSPTPPLSRQGRSRRLMTCVVSLVILTRVH